ncbi:MAG: glycosyltransferase family 4 protein [Candidatus Aminicenantaceae bacterium]
MEDKVLHILWNGSIGGTPRAVFQLVQSQLRQSPFVPAVAFAQDGGYYCEEIKKLGCEVLSLKVKNDRNIFNVLRMKNIFEKYPIHHFHSVEVAMMFASIRSRNAVRVYTHRGGIFKYRGKRRIRYKIGGWYLRNYFHGLSGNTEHACSSGASLFGIESSKWHLTYNGIDFSIFNPMRQKRDVPDEIQFPPDGAVTIGTSAQLREWKRIDLLLRACAQLPRRSFRLLILGDGPAKQKLEDLARKLVIADHTTFAGMKENIEDYIPLMDIFVLPSLGLESFGNAVVEAMSQGIPAIVFSDGGGLLEHVQNGSNGYIVSSVDELTERLKSLIKNQLLRSQLGRNAEVFVKTNYTLERMVASYDNLYISAIDNKKKKNK